MFTYFLSFLLVSYIFAWNCGLIEDPETEPEWKQLNRIRRYTQSKEFQRKYEKYIKSLEKKFRKEVENMSAEEKMLRAIDRELNGKPAMTNEEIAQALVMYKEDLDEYYAETCAQDYKFTE